MISAFLKTSNTCKNQYKLVRSFSKISVEKFNKFWQKILTVTDNNIETVFKQFYTLITQDINKHASLKKRLQKTKASSKPT